MTSITVIIPSRVQLNQARFLTRAVRSVESQKLRRLCDIEVVVGVDPEDTPPALDSFDIPLRFVNAQERSAGAAINAAVARGSGEYLAILEDDDAWEPDHLEVSLQALEHCAFASGTQLEVDPEGAVVRVNDFPTPDSWVMTRDTWERVGPFDTSYRYHADNEWLGRLAENSVPRIHLVESTAPVSVDVARQVRPWLARLIELGGGQVHLKRHHSPVPLVRRLVHPDAGMQRIATDSETKATSDHEYDRLIRRYGRIPW